MSKKLVSCFKELSFAELMTLFVVGIVATTPFILLSVLLYFAYTGGRASADDIHRVTERASQSCEAARLWADYLAKNKSPTKKDLDEISIEIERAHAQAKARPGDGLCRESIESSTRSH